MAEVIQQRSSFIAETTYYTNPEDEFEPEDLVVEFTDGARWVYHNVRRGAYVSLITSASCGKAFHRLIKDRYDGEPL